MAIAACIRNEALLFHNLPRALRYLRLLLHLAVDATVAEPFIHLSLPAFVVILKRHI